MFELSRWRWRRARTSSYAHALLRCGTQEELAADPDNRLRLSVGLRRENGRWVVAHEHHSFALKD